ncbi:ATP-binding protein [Corynebacterium sp.]|uniref:ATP-binding protein n=1 Tax=Corynebacterium sp. TaxID=1720 RepID=UPI0026DBD840|nr:ATP-binding protein [Corynebacterium sp.]MDO5032285.1 ATP-binding protein [Corynebacterium sp.]
MKLVSRQHLLAQLHAWDSDPALDDAIRVITGVRRCGKSSLLRLYEDSLDGAHVLSLNFELLSTQSLRESSAFHAVVMQAYREEGITHLLIDEVQELEDWARTVNSLRAETDLRILVTGSNASMFAGEGMTYLAGRYVELEVLPLSLAEFQRFRGEELPAESAYAQWMKGTLPAAALATESSHPQLNNAVFDSIFTRDIAMRGAIQEPAVFLRVARFVFDNAGSPLSVNRIAGTLTSAGFKTSNHTIERYLQLMVDAHMFYACRPYDLRGREHLRSRGKFYFVDPGLRDALLGERTSNSGHDLENMVYLELRRRGYAVSVARSGNQEIDFMATKEQHTTYIQVALSALDEDTLKRELSAFAGAPTGARCVLITFDRLPLNTGAVEHLNAGDFLLGADLLRSSAGL